MVNTSAALPPRGRPFRSHAVRALAGVLLLLAFTSTARAQEEDDIPSGLDMELGLSDDLDIGGLLDIIDVVVTPAKKEQTIEQAPSVITVIKDTDIAEGGYRSVADALRQVPGLYVRDDLVHPNVSMRGVDAGLRAWSRSMKVMINGQPISYRSDTSNWLGPELIAMDAISRIEVVRGPSSTLYGANAFLGVINIITKEGFKDDWVHASIESGALISPCPKGNGAVVHEGETVDVCGEYATTVNPTVSLSATAGHRIELNQSTTLSFLGSTVMGYTNRSGLMLPATSPHFNSTGPKYYQGPDSDITSQDDTDMSLGAFGSVDLLHETLGKLRVEGHYSEFARGGEFTDWGVLTHENKVGMRNWFVRLSYDKRLQSIPLTYRVQVALASGNHTPANRLQIARNNTFWVKKVGGYWGIDLNGELAYDITPKITLITGTNLINDFHDLPSISSVDKGDESIEIPSYTQDDVHFLNFAVFAQLLYAPIKPLSLIAGVSYEQHNVYGQCSWGSCPGLNSRLGASYSIIKTGDLSLYTKVMYGSSFKAPSAELLYGTPYVISGISGNLDLEPQVAHTFEAALGSGVMLAERRLRLDVLINGFFNLVGGKVEYIQAGNFIRAQNSSDLETLGIESSVKLSYRKAASGYVNLSWQKTAVSSCLLEDPTLCRRLSEFNALYPDFLLSFGATYRVPSIWMRFSLHGAFVGERWASQSNRAENLPSEDGGGFDRKAYRLPSYLLLNLVISSMDLHLLGDKETVFSLGLYNLLNSGIVEPGFNGIDTPGMGLTVVGSVKQHF